MTSGTDILSALRDSSVILNAQQIKEAVQMLRTRHANLTRQAAHTFHYNEAVKFKDLGGFERVGKVLKVNQKTVSVMVGTTTWRVGPTILQKVSASPVAAAPVSAELSVGGSW
jgi:hypothetical protein